jgi:cysteine desulfurase/selenocysteine lyase
MFNELTIRRDFPILSIEKNKRPLVYLDSTATTLKPKCVIDTIREYYESYSANVFRGIYSISEKATAEYENSRKLTAALINASSPE